MSEASSLCWLREISGRKRDKVEVGRGMKTLLVEGKDQRDPTLLNDRDGL